MAQSASEFEAGFQPAPPPTPDTTLAKDRLGVIGIVFFVVAAAAPLVGMTGAVPVAIGLGNGSGAPGAYLGVGIALLVFSVGYAAMSHRVTNTGAFFAYVGRGLGISPGVGSAFVSLVAYIAIQLAIFGFFGGLLSGQMNAQFGINWPWYVWVLIAWVLVTGLSLLSVDVGAKVLGVLMICELCSLAALAIAVLVHGGGPDGLGFAASFAPSHVFAGGFTGSAGIALAFAFASYIGFEATAIYGEEARDPKRAVPRATYLAVGLIAILFAFTSWAVVSGLGSDHVVAQTMKLSTVGGAPLADPAQVIFHVATQYVGSWLATVMSWLVVSSLFAGLLAFQNSGARYFYSMGRAGVLPSRLGHVSRLGTPAPAAITMSSVSLLVIAIFTFGGLDPILNMFYWFSGLAVIAVVLVEILVSIAVIAYFRQDKSDTRIWNTVVAPALAIVGLAMGLYLLMSRFGLLAGTTAKGVDPTTTAWGLSITGWALVTLPFAVFIVGSVLGSALQRRENVDAIADLVS